MNNTIKIEIAEAFARNHENYLCAMANKIINCNIAKMTENRMKRIDETIEAVLRAGNEETWVKNGNHKMTYCTWEEMIEMCKKAKN